MSVPGMISSVSQADIRNPLRYLVKFCLAAFSLTDIFSHDNIIFSCFIFYEPFTSTFFQNITKLIFFLYIMCSDKEKDVLFSIKYLKKGTVMCVFYNISVYLSPKKTVIADLNRKL